jgi:carbon-monoxide dehydrogenase large subunit
MAEDNSDRDTSLTPYVGSSIRRVADTPLLLGRSEFVGDMHRDRELHARVVRSDVAHGRIIQVHTEVARGCPGVVAVITAQDIPAVRIPVRLPFAATSETNAALQPALASDRVRYVGEPLAVVIATDRYVAEDAAREVWVDLEELTPVIGTRGAVSTESPLLNPELGTNVFSPIPIKYGEDVAELFRKADVVVSAKLRMQRHTAIPLEPRGLIAEYNPELDSLTVWGGKGQAFQSQRA